MRAALLTLTKSALRSRTIPASAAPTIPNARQVPPLAPSRIRVSPTTLIRQSSTSSEAPLLHLSNASLKHHTGPVSWTISNPPECWAIIAAASDSGGHLRRELIDILVGRSRPSPPHPSPLSLPANAIKHVSFATRMGSSSTSNEFTNYSARYGAIREEDRVTLYERLMDLLGSPVGLVAENKFVPDPFATDDNEVVGRFKYSSESQRRAALEKAQEADKVIKSLAPLLLITPELLARPVIALSNGQTRRARILSSLITGAELVVLEEPFSGIDVGTRTKLCDLFAELHAKRRPRLVLVLREQDAIPSLVTHVLRIDDEGEIVSNGPFSHSSSDAQEETKTGADLVKANAENGVGIGDTSAKPLVELKEVSIIYGEKTVLNKVDLSIHPTTRLVLAGDNGSGKTTLLALILGDHPKSFSLPSSSLSLFGHARDHPTNARTLLNRRVGHLSPELFNAFPRKPPSLGGLTVGEVVASGLENVFARRAYSQEQKERVWGLLGLFSDLIKLPTTSQGSKKGEEGIQALSGRGFAELSHGSQALVLFLRAVVGNPQLLVLDEPFQGMDRRQVDRTRRFIDHPEQFPLGSTSEEVEQDLEERKRMAIVLVSHYESEWPTTFGSLLRLSDGDVVQRI